MSSDKEKAFAGIQHLIIKKREGNKKHKIASPA